jgi:hypothetical protein
MNEYQLADYETDLFLKALDGFSAQENPRAVPRLRKDEFLPKAPCENGSSAMMVWIRIVANTPARISRSRKETCATSAASTII